MKVLRQLGILLVFIVIVTAILSLVLPTSQKIERTVTINASAATVYEQLVKLENFNKISIWNQRDTSVRHKLYGTDGTVGASYNWEGNPEISGNGNMTITSLDPNKKIEHDLEFTSPKKGRAHSVFTLNEINGSTTVTWIFRKATPRPWNIFNLFYSMDKEMGGDFEEGLASLKKMAEPAQSDTTLSKTINVKPLNFPATSYAIIRQQVKWEDIPTFYSLHWVMTCREIALKDTLHITRVGLIYNWDEKLRQAEIGAGVIVTPGTKTNSPVIEIINIPASKAVYVDYSGDIKNTNELYPAIRKYLSENKLKQTGPIIEQLRATDGIEPAPISETIRIIFLVE